MSEEVPRRPYRAYTKSFIDRGRDGKGRDRQTGRRVDGKMTDIDDESKLETQHHHHHHHHQQQQQQQH